MYVPAYKLLSNHERVLLDLTNPSTDLNIDGKPLTQALKLKRIASQHTAHADGFLRELTRRLLGKREASLFVELRGKLQAAAWIAASKYQFSDARDRHASLIALRPEQGLAELGVELGLTNGLMGTVAKHSHNSQNNCIYEMRASRDPFVDRSDSCSIVL